MFSRIEQIAQRNRRARIVDYVYAAFLAAGLAVMGAAAIPASVAASGPAPVKAPCVDADYIATANAISEPDQQYLAACRTEKTDIESNDLM